MARPLFFGCGGVFRARAHRLVAAAGDLLLCQLARVFDGIHQMQHLATPHLPIRALPAEEQRMARIIQSQIYELEHYLENFLAAVELFSFCVSVTNQMRRTQRSTMFTPAQLEKWRMIAARDGALSIWHSWHAIEACRRGLPFCHTLRDKVDADKVRESGKVLKEHFPNFEPIRHSIAHRAELAKNEQRWEEHAFRGVYDGPAIKVDGTEEVFLHGLQGTEYTATFEGKILTYSVTLESVEKLAEVRSLFYEAFPFSALDLPRKQKPPSPAPPDQTPRTKE